MLIVRCFGQRAVLLTTAMVLCLTIAVYGNEDDLPSQEFRLQEIYDDLIEILGRESRSWPRLEVLGVRNRVASYSKSENTIWIDKHTLNVCKLLGDRGSSAIAFLIGHELCHFYRKHEVRESGFGGGFLSTKVTISAQQEIEIEADIFGAFVAEQAGYPVLTIVDTLLDLIYDDYLLSPFETLNYPSLEVRKNLAHESCDLAVNLVDIYEKANYAFVLGLYQESYNLYTWIRGYLEFEELNLNLAMAYLGDYFAITNSRVKYPFIIEPEIPIVRGHSLRSPDDLLTQANLEFVKLSDNHYSQNKVSRLYSLFTKHKINGTLKSSQLLEWSEDKRFKDVYPQVILANLLHSSGNINEAKEIYDSLLLRKMEITEKNLVQYNRSIVFNVDDLEDPGYQQVYFEKDIDGLASINRVEAFDHEFKISHDISIQKKHLFGSVFTSLVSGGLAIYKLQRVFDPSVISSKGGFIGQEYKIWSNIYAKYRLVSARHSKGFYALIPDDGILLKLDSDYTISEWCIYSY